MFKIRLADAKKIFEWQDVIDLLDEVGRYIDKQEEEIKVLQDDKDRLIKLLELEKRSSQNGNK